MRYGFLWHTTIWVVLRDKGKMLLFFSACTTTDLWHQTKSQIKKEQGHLGVQAYEVAEFPIVCFCAVWNFVHLGQGDRSVKNGNARDHALGGGWKYQEDLTTIEVNWLTVYAEVLTVMPLRKRYPPVVSTLTITIYWYIHRRFIQDGLTTSQRGNCVALSAEYIGRDMSSL